MTHLWRVYRMRDPLTKETRYIGITSQTLTSRLAFHLRGNDHNPEKQSWITDLGKQGLRPEIEQIDSLYGTKASAEQRERQWVYRYLIQGAILLNQKHIPGSQEHLRAFLRANKKVIC